MRVKSTDIKNRRRPTVGNLTISKPTSRSTSSSVRIKSSEISRKNTPTPKKTPRPSKSAVAPKSVATRQKSEIIKSTLSQKVKRPDIVKSVIANNAPAKPTTVATRSRRAAQTADGKTLTRVVQKKQTYAPNTAKEKNQHMLLLGIGGLVGFFLLLIVVIVIVGYRKDEPEMSATAKTYTGQKTNKSLLSNRGRGVSYGKGSWANDPEKVAAMKSSKMYQDREAMKKNYRKNR